MTDLAVIALLAFLCGMVGGVVVWVLLYRWASRR